MSLYEFSKNTAWFHPNEAVGFFLNLGKALRLDKQNIWILTHVSSCSYIDHPNAHVILKHNFLSSRMTDYSLFCLCFGNTLKDVFLWPLQSSNSTNFSLSLQCPQHTTEQKQTPNLLKMLAKFLCHICTSPSVKSLEYGYWFSKARLCEVHSNWVVLIPA